MPRTVWKQGNPRLQGHPQWDNPTYLRGCAEEAHYEVQRKAFHIPLSIRPGDDNSTTITEPRLQHSTHASTTAVTVTTTTTPPPALTALSSSSSYRLDFRDHFNRHTSRLLSDLNPDDYRAFCWKDCAIYASSPLVTGKDYMLLLDEVYREWYPHRAEDKDISDGSFFGKLMRFVTYPASSSEAEAAAVPKKKKKATSLGEVARFHRLLWAQLKELEPRIGPEVPVHPCAVGDPTPRLAEYRLRDTFEKVFVVLDDAAWQSRGVLLVWGCETDAERHGCDVTTTDEEEEDDGRGDDDDDGREVRIRLEGHDDDDDDDAADLVLFRCSLKRAMQLVVSTDPQRALMRREWNEMLEEMLGDE